MLKLSTSYSKKIPVEGREFSSQSFHASVELELSDALSPEQIREKIHDSALLLRRSVDEELGGNAAGEAAGPEGSRKPDARPEGARPESAERKASNKQIKYLTDLATERKVPLGELNADIRRRFNVEGLYDLTSRQASALLDEMNGRQRRAA